jgi:hypothetical protein
MIRVSTGAYPYRMAETMIKAFLSLWEQVNERVLYLLAFKTILTKCPFICTFKCTYKPKGAPYENDIFHRFPEKGLRFYR